MIADSFKIILSWLAVYKVITNSGLLFVGPPCILYIEHAGSKPLCPPLYGIIQYNASFTATINYAHGRPWRPLVFHTSRAYIPNFPRSSNAIARHVSSTPDMPGSLEGWEGRQIGESTLRSSTMRIVGLETTVKHMKYTVATFYTKRHIRIRIFFKLFILEFLDE